MPFRRLLPALAIAASFLTACGGGGGNPGVPTSAAPGAGQPVAIGSSITRLVVAGDSLADVGTVGYKATVQSAVNPTVGYPLYPEVVAQQLGTGPLCSHYTTSNEGQTFGTRSTCTDFAVASAAIANPVTRGGDTSPFSLKQQLDAALAANGGGWRTSDLVLIDGGANDAAGLADSYLGALRGGAAEQAVFVALLSQQLPLSTINTALAQSNGGSVAATLYMQQLARSWWALVKADTLDKGATHVALLNIPDITFTPRYRDVVASATVDLGPTAALTYQAAVRSWIVAFNTELAQLAAGDARVTLVDLFGAFTGWNTSPSTYGLTNTTQAACPASFSFPQCTDAARDAAPPVGVAGAGWWRTWLYADRFHPTPRGHELIAALVLQAVPR